MQTGNIGVLLVNLGTPEQPNTSAVKAFLTQFLRDKRVVDLHRWRWLPILHGIVLPTRAPKVAKLYQSIWFSDRSPLMFYSERQQEKLREKLDFPVELGMTYGKPSIQAGIVRLLQQKVDTLVVLPLYPQYSATTVGSVFDAVATVLASLRIIPHLHFIRDYHDHPLYIQGIADSVRKHWQKKGKGDYLLCSYHGIPQRYADEGDIYPLHCERTTQLLAKELGLDESRIGLSYQSRFGREEWLKPYTSDLLTSMPKRGVKNLDIISPAFSVDCLETLEEIAEQGKNSFLMAGGDEYHFISCLNDEDIHIDLMQELIKTCVGV